MTGKKPSVSIPEVHDSDLLLDNQLCFALYSTSLLMTKLYKPLLRDLGLTYPQYLVMLVLWEEDAMTVGSLARRLLTDSGSLTPLLKRLEAMHLLKRVRAREDERVVHLQLTTEGRDLRQRAETIPACVASTTGRNYDELMEVKNTLVQLRNQLQRALDP